VSEDQILLKGKSVIKIEGDAILNLINNIDQSFIKTVRLIEESKGRVVFTGMGKSGIIARKIVATLNSTGTAAFFMHPTDALHGDLGMVRKQDVAILISKSGNTEELLLLMPILKRIGVSIIGILGNVSSKMAKECDVVLNVSVKEEACPHDVAPTASTTATLVMGDAVAIALLDMRGITKEDLALLHPGGSLGKRLSLRIEEIMIKDKDIPVVYEKASLKDTILEITSKRLGVTCVVDKDGKMLGIITDGDLRRLLERTLDIKNICAGDIMSKNPKRINPSVLASFALQMMENYKITSLAVTDPDTKPIGIVHLHDLVNLGLKIR